MVDTQNIVSVKEKDPLRIKFTMKEIYICSRQILVVT